MRQTVLSDGPMDERQMRQPSRFRSPHHQSMTGRITGAGLVHFRAWEQVQPWVLAARHHGAGREFHSQFPSQRRSPGNRTMSVYASECPPRTATSAAAGRSRTLSDKSHDAQPGSWSKPRASQDLLARTRLDASWRLRIGFSLVLPDRRTCDQPFPLFTFRQRACD